MVNVAAEDVAAYAGVLENAYLMLWRRWKPEQKVFSVKNQEKLKSLAAQLLANNISPHNYVRRMFEHFAAMTGTVTIDMLAAPYALQHYLDNKSERDKELDLTLRVQMRNFEKAMKEGRSIREILTDYTLSLSAVFRYAIAYSTGERDLSEQFRADAEQMLLFEPIYKKALANLLPRETVNV